MLMYNKNLINDEANIHSGSQRRDDYDYISK